MQWHGRQEKLQLCRFSELLHMFVSQAALTEPGLQEVQSACNSVLALFDSAASLAAAFASCEQCAASEGLLARLIACLEDIMLKVSGSLRCWQPAASVVGWGMLALLRAASWSDI